jgi:hypothetical protein
MKYVGTNELYNKVELGLFELTSLMSSWAICVVESPYNNMEFHFIKNGN